MFPFRTAILQLHVAIIRLNNLVQITKVGTQTFKLQITLHIVFIKLSKGCHIFQSLIYSMFLRVQVSQDPCFSRSRVFRVQVFLALGPSLEVELIVALNFSLLCQIFLLQVSAQENTQTKLDHHLKFFIHVVMFGLSIPSTT